MAYENTNQSPTTSTQPQTRYKRKKLSQKEKLKRYMADIDSAKRIMEPLHKEWERYARFYANDQWGNEVAGGAKPQDGVTVNQIAPIINTILPSIVTQSPRLRVTPLRPQDDETAPLVEAVLNYEWKRLGVNDEMRTATLDMLVYGVGWLKTGYEFAETEIPRDPEEVEAEVQELLARTRDIVAGNFVPYGAQLTRGFTPSPEGPQFGDVLAPPNVEQTGAGEALAAALAPPESSGAAPEIAPQAVPTEAEIRESVATTEFVVEKDDIFVERISPFDILLDPEAKDLKHAKWIAHRIVKPIEEVRGDKRYQNTARLQATASSPARPMNNPNNELADYTDRVILWEYYNLVDHTICVMAEGHDQFLLESENPYPFQGSCFTELRDYLVPDSFWAFGEVKLIEQVQVELNKIRTQMLTHNKRFNRKVIYRKEAFDQEGQAALKSNKDGVFVPLQPGQSVTDSVYPIPDAPLPTDRYQIAQLIANDIIQLTGISDYDRGGNVTIRRTATEAAMIENASSLRQRDKLDRVERAATEVGRRMKALAQTFYDAPRWILITGDGMHVPEVFSRADIQGEFDVDVDAGSSQPANEALKIQQAERMYQMLRSDPLVNPIELLKNVLMSYGIKGPDRYINVQGMMLPENPDPSIPGAQPGYTEGSLPQPGERQEAVEGGAAAAGVPA